MFPNTSQQLELGKQLDILVSKFQKDLSSLYGQITEQHHQLQIVNEIGKLLISSLDNQEILRQLMRQLIAQFRVERASFWLVDHINGIVTYQFSLNRLGKENEISESVQSLPPFKVGGDSIVGKIAQDNQPRLDNDLASNADYFEIPGLPPNRNLLAVPLSSDQRTIGIIQLFNRLGDESFIEKDLELLTAIAPWVAVALKNANLYNQVQAINEIGHQIISTLDYREILRHLMTRLIQKLSAQRGSFWLVNHTNQEVRFQFSLNQQGQEDEISAVISQIGSLQIDEKSIVGKVAKDGLPILENNLALNPHHLPVLDKISGLPPNKNMIAIPLKRDELTIGVIQILNRINNQPFVLEDQNLLMAIAPWVAQALENAQLYERTLQKIIVLHQKQLEAEKIAHQHELDARSAAITRVMAHHLKNQLGSSRFYLKSLKKSLDQLTRNFQKIDAIAQTLFNKPYFSLYKSVAKLRHELLDITHYLSYEDKKIDKADNNIKRSIDISTGLLKPYQPGERTTIAPKQLIVNSIKLLDCPPYIEIHNMVSDGLPNVYLEANNAVDYLHEMLKNAVKASQERMNNNKELKTAEIIIKEGSIGAEMMELLLSNQGIPIPKERWETIFDQFTTSSNSSENFGLGLWGTRTFFNRQGGSVRVCKSDGFETVFVVCLPLAQAI